MTRYICSFMLVPYKYLCATSKIEEKKQVDTFIHSNFRRSEWKKRSKLFWYAPQNLCQYTRTIKEISLRTFFSELDICNLQCFSLRSFILGIGKGHCLIHRLSVIAAITASVPSDLDMHLSKLLWPLPLLCHSISAIWLGHASVQIALAAFLTDIAWVPSDMDMQLSQLYSNGRVPYCHSLSAIWLGTCSCPNCNVRVSNKDVFFLVSVSSAIITCLATAKILRYIWELDNIRCRCEFLGFTLICLGASFLAWLLWFKRPNSPRIQPVKDWDSLETLSLQKKSDSEVFF